MTDTPAPDPLHAPPATRQGATRTDATPRVETVRVTAPDLSRRIALERSRLRIVCVAGGFGVLFLATLGKLVVATVIAPLAPHRVERAVAEIVQRAAAPDNDNGGAVHTRAMITDRNGEILAISLPTASVYANPREMIDIEDASQKLKRALPRLDLDVIRERLQNGKQFVYLARQVTPKEQLAVNTLGIPGVYFEQTERRRYPLGRTAAHVLGGTDVDGHGVAGVERFFDQALRDVREPLRLSLDVRVQAIIRDELLTAMNTFGAIGATGVVMDVRTGEIVGLVSLPDYDANLVGSAKDEERFNRAVTGDYEPGSTFKLQTAAMALDAGVANIWNEYDATSDLKIGRFTIADFEGKHRWLYLPEVLAYSSNIGAARVAVSAGAERQRAWLRGMGMFSRIGVELPEESAPIYPPASNWKEIATMTIGFGHGIAVSPLHVVRGTAAIATGMVTRPTLIAHETSATPADAVRVMQPATSDIMRKLMRLVVTDGYGKTAEVPGYYPGGKTGTAEKVGAHGYKKHANVAAFTSVFPMNAPRYAVYMMLDEPHATAATHGYATAGWVIAPSVGHVIARIGPMLGLLPDLEHAAEINRALSIPLQPGRPAGVSRAPPPPPPPMDADRPVASLSPNAPRALPAGVPRAPTQPAVLPPSPPPAPAPARDSRRQASLRTEPAE